jgi:hypothetical protein
MERRVGRKEVEATGEREEEAGKGREAKLKNESCFIRRMRRGVRCIKRVMGESTTPGE